jgi:carbamate kinase
VAKNPSPEKGEARVKAKKPEGVRTLVIALGGNAIIPAGRDGTIDEQLELTRATMTHVANLIKAGHEVAVTHGNGPVVGNIVIRNEKAKDEIPPMPLDVCGADSEGGIGYMMQQGLQNQLASMNIDRDVFTIITQVIVGADDPAFKKPTKPIGPFYSREDAEAMAGEKGWVVIEDSGRGYRRVVPSPKPLEIVERRAIGRAIDGGAIVIAVGGGGVPVVRDASGMLRGVEAVIDKDRASSVLARQINADTFAILTEVEKVALRYGKPDQRDLDVITVAEAKEYLARGEFPPGSMGPKIESAIEFLEGGGRQVIITKPELLSEALAGRRCTTIVP